MVICFNFIITVVVFIGFDVFWFWGFIMSFFQYFLGNIFNVQVILCFVVVLGTVDVSFFYDGFVFVVVVFNGGRIVLVLPSYMFNIVYSVVGSVFLVFVLV